MFVFSNIINVYDDTENTHWSEYCSNNNKDDDPWHLDGIKYYGKGFPFF
jgi:hypothetical protein